MSEHIPAPGHNPGPPAPFKAAMGHKTTINGARILEALIIAAVAAWGSSQLTIARFDERLTAMDKVQQRLERSVDEMKRDVYRPRWDAQQRVPGDMQALAPDPGIGGFR
jgi:hypothetical protein